MTDQCPNFEGDYLGDLTKILVRTFLAKLDGTTEKVKSRLAQHTSIEDWLELGDDYNKPSETGKKRVRWADLEEKKSQARREKIGFVVGGRNWASQSDRERSAQGALERTKFIPSRFQSEFHAQ